MTLLAAAASMALTGAQTESSLLLAVIADGKGSLSTVTAFVQGSSQKLSLMRDVGWHRASPGLWLWVKQRGDSIKFGSNQAPPGEFKPALSLGSRTWQTAWIEGGHLSLGLYGSEPSLPAALWSFSRLGEPSLTTDREKLALEEAWGKLPQREQEKWEAPGFLTESSGRFRREGVMQRGMHLVPKGEAQPTQADPAALSRTFLLTAEVEGLSSLAWRSAKSTGGMVLDAIGSDKTGLGFILSQEGVRLTPYTGERFGSPSRRLALEGARITAFQSWTGRESQAVLEELKKQKA